MVINLLYMNVQKNSLTSSERLCKECHLFFGADDFQGLCSTCFKNNQPMLQNETNYSAQTCVPTSIFKVQFVRDVDGNEQVLDKFASAQQKDRKRCFTCNKKIGLLGIECKCCFIFCNGHRLPQSHKCKFDHKGLAYLKLHNEMVKVETSKVKEI